MDGARGHETQRTTGSGFAEHQAAGGDERTARALASMLARMVLAYERFEARWRSQWSLSANEKLVVTFIAFGGPVTPGALSAALGLSSGGLTALLDRLERDGFVRRRAHPTDRRSVLLEATTRTLDTRAPLLNVAQRLAAVDEQDPQLAESALRAIPALTQALEEEATRMRGRRHRGAA